MTKNDKYTNKENATDLAVTALQHAITTDEQQLADPAARSGLAVDELRIVVISSQRIHTYPETRILYYPFRSSLPEAPAELFSDGEHDEFRLQDYTSAIRKFRSLAQSPNVATRAGALLRIARNLRKSNDLAAALKEYGDLAQHASVSVFGVPADLVGRDARCFRFAAARPRKRSPKRSRAASS